MKIFLKTLNDSAKLPVQGRPGDFCYDVCAVSEEEIAPNVWKYKLGFSYEMDKTQFYIGKLENKFSSHMQNQELVLDIDFRPRSSIWKTGMVLSNCEGTLDQFYRGEVCAIFYHILPNMPRYKSGDKIGQIKVGITIPVEFEFVDEIDMNTERGTGGFGSTGK